MKPFSIRKKMLVLFIPLFLVSYFFLSFLLLYIVNGFYRSQLYNSYQNQTLTLALQLNSILDEPSLCAVNLLYDFNMVENLSLLQRTELSTLEDYLRDKEILRILNSYLLIYPQISSISLYTSDNILYSTEYGMENYWNNQARDIVLKSIQEYRSMDIWFPYEKRNYLTDDPTRPSLTMGKNLVEIFTGDTIGFLYLNLDETELSSLYAPLETEYTSYYIVDKNGKIISATDKLLLEQDKFYEVIRKGAEGNQTSMDLRFDQKNCFVTINPLSQNDLYLLSVTDHTALWEAARSIYLWVLLASVLSFLVLAAVIIVFARRLTVPLEDLIQRMRNVDLTFQETGVVTPRDEIGELTDYFNQMVLQIQNTFRDLKKSEEQKRDLQLALLQNQIKPHFLYNSLDTIYVLEFMGRHQDAMASTKALADFYRSALSGGEEIVTIGQELEMISNYLVIQNFRHSNFFRCAVRVPESLWFYAIPKLTLQPILENALYHGLREKKEPGNLCVVGYEEGNFIFLSVSDDGVGIRPEVLNNLHSNPSSHFGLHSVDTRIKLYFSEECGLSVASEPGEGTVVTIKLLKKKREDVLDE